MQGDRVRVKLVARGALRCAHSLLQLAASLHKSPHFDDISNDYNDEDLPLLSGALVQALGEEVPLAWLQCASRLLSPSGALRWALELSTGDLLDGLSYEGLKPYIETPFARLNDEAKAKQPGLGGPTSESALLAYSNVVKRLGGRQFQSLFSEGELRSIDEDTILCIFGQIEGFKDVPKEEALAYFNAGLVLWNGVFQLDTPKLTLWTALGELSPVPPCQLVESPMLQLLVYTQIHLLSNGVGDKGTALDHFTDWALLNAGEQVYELDKHELKFEERAASMRMIALACVPIIKRHELNTLDGTAESKDENATLRWQANCKELMRIYPAQASEEVLLLLALGCAHHARSRRVGRARWKRTPSWERWCGAQAALVRRSCSNLSSYRSSPSSTATWTTQPGTSSSPTSARSRTRRRSTASTI
ncbi:hypothetical protein T492DRAFT_528394 [Pavlovales sp. CCMP2436]|nr:hypothetical protein T492DRAFT_528394 [Pavlovales sp. CCMP2436]